jgi:hypothetical protein
MNSQEETEVPPHGTQAFMDYMVSRHLARNTYVPYGGHKETSPKTRSPLTLDPAKAGMCEELALEKYSKMRNTQPEGQYMTYIRLSPCDEDGHIVPLEGNNDSTNSQHAVIVLSNCTLNDDCIDDSTIIDVTYIPPKSTSSGMELIRPVPFGQYLEAFIQLYKAPVARVHVKIPFAHEVCQGFNADQPNPQHFDVDVNDNRVVNERVVEDQPNSTDKIPLEFTKSTFPLGPAVLQMLSNFIASDGAVACLNGSTLFYVMNSLIDGLQTDRFQNGVCDAHLSQKDVNTIMTIIEKSRTNNTNEDEFVQHEKVIEIVVQFATQIRNHHLSLAR